MRQLICLVLAAVVVAGSDSDVEEKKDITWDYLLFAQVWPYSLCDAVNQLKNESCLVPKKVFGGWTIHGLWPSHLNGQMGPEFCVPADHFDLDKVKPIVGELLHHWPNLIPDDPVFSLWQHEWLKHGTCAEQLPQIKGELLYFQAGLQLIERFSIKRILSSYDIDPSEEPKFKAADITGAIEKAKGKQVQVHCLKAKDHDTGKAKWYLVDVRICLDKTLNLIDCPQHHKPGVHYAQSELIQAMGIPDVEQCPPDELLYYVPPRDDHYHDEHFESVHKYAYNYHDDYAGRWDKEFSHDEL